MEKIRCSVPILTLNCIEGLKKCLESISDFNDIVILDGNSTDGTREFSLERGARVFNQFDSAEPNQKITNFSAMRIRAMEKISEKWVFCLDSDEYASKELVDEVRGIIQNDEKNTAYACKVMVIINGRLIKYAFFEPEQALRLYRTDVGIHYRKDRILHETEFVPDNIEQKITRGVIYTEWPSFDDLAAKDAHYLSLFEKKAVENIESFTIRKAIRKIFLNFLKAAKIAIKSAALYARHGFKETLPPRHVWRYVKYHLSLSMIVAKIKLWKMLKKI